MKGFLRKNLILFYFLCGLLPYNRLVLADQLGDQTKVLKSYYPNKLNNHLISFDNLSSFVFSDASDRIFISKKNSGLLARLNNNWIGNNSKYDYKAYNVNLDLGYSLVISNFLLMPIFEVGFTSSRSDYGIKTELNNWSFIVPGIYTFYSLENGVFGDIFFSYRIDNGSNKTKSFENYIKSKDEKGINVRTSIGWNFTSEDNISLTPRIAFNYNRINLNSNNIIDKNWIEPEEYYKEIKNIDYDIFYITPTVKLEFNNMFRDSNILSYFVNFFSVDFKYRKNVGSNDHIEKGTLKYDLHREFESGLEATVALGLKTKIGLWYAVSFERTNAFHLDLGYKF